MITDILLSDLLLCLLLSVSDRLLVSPDYNISHLTSGFNLICFDCSFCRYSLHRNQESKPWISVAMTFLCVEFLLVFLFPSYLHSHRRMCLWFNVFYYRKNLKSFFARYKMSQWTSSYALPDFPYDVKCTLAEKKCPDHSMRIRIIEFLQADMTKYLEGSLWVNIVMSIWGHYLLAVEACFQMDVKPLSLIPLLK